MEADEILYFTNHEAGQVLQLIPGGEPEILSTIPGKATGLTLTPEGSLLLTAIGERGQQQVYQITPTGETTLVLTLEDAIFLNGITALTEDYYLIADSYGGLIWQLDLRQPSAEVWLEHPLLARASEENPIPAVNGLKRFEDTLYVSNTQKQLLLQIPILNEDQPGDPEIFVENVNIDDFVLDPEGNLYGATHIYNSIIQITPEGSVTIIAGLDQGATGSTAVALQTSPDQDSLVVVTNGGMFLPPETGIEPAQVLRLQIPNPLSQ